MKINNPLEIKFPFNVNNEKDYNFMINRLDKLGYTRLQFNKKLKFKYPVRFICINNHPNYPQYIIYND